MAGKRMSVAAAAGESCHRPYDNYNHDANASSSCSPPVGFGVSRRSAVLTPNDLAVDVSNRRGPHVSPAPHLAPVVRAGAAAGSGPSNRSGAAATAAHADPHCGGTPAGVSPNASSTDTAPPTTAMPTSPPPRAPPVLHDIYQDRGGGVVEADGGDGNAGCERSAPLSASVRASRTAGTTRDGAGACVPPTDAVPLPGPGRPTPATPPHPQNLQQLAYDDGWRCYTNDRRDLLVSVPQYDLTLGTTATTAAAFDGSPATPQWGWPSPQQQPLQPQRRAGGGDDKTETTTPPHPSRPHIAAALTATFDDRTEAPETPSPMPPAALPGAGGVPTPSSTPLRAPARSGAAQAPPPALPLPAVRRVAGVATAPAAAPTATTPPAHTSHTNDGSSSIARARDTSSDDGADLAWVFDVPEEGGAREVGTYDRDPNHQTSRAPASASTAGQPLPRQRPAAGAGGAARTTPEPAGPVRGGRDGAPAPSGVATGADYSECDDDGGQLAAAAPPSRDPQQARAAQGNAGPMPATPPSLSPWSADSRTGASRTPSIIGHVAPVATSPCPAAPTDVVLVLTVQVAPGTDRSLVYNASRDDAARVAAGFLRQHGLPAVLAPALTGRILRAYEEEVGGQGSKTGGAAHQAAVSAGPGVNRACETTRIPHAEGGGGGPPRAPSASQQQRQAAAVDAHKARIEAAAAARRVRQASASPGPCRTARGPPHAPPARRARSRAGTPKAARPRAATPPGAAGTPRRMQDAGCASSAAVMAACSRLHDLGMEHKRAAAARAAEHRARQERAEMESSPFAPEISPTAKAIVRRPAAYRTRRVAAAGANVEEQELRAHCTFAPKLSARTETIVHTLRVAAAGAPDVAFESLYADAEHRRMRALQMGLPATTTA